MREYLIQPRTAALPELEGRVFDPETEPFCAREYAPIDCYAWPGDYRPEARAYVAWDADGLNVLLCAKEATTIAKATEFCGDVWMDSCLEFFVQPFEDDPRYLNIETNCAGTALIGIGPNRDDRRRPDACPPDMALQASRHEGGWWAVRYRLSFALIESFFGRRPAAGSAMRGNFYSCDETIHPHFGSWNPIVSPEPDFHRPECFGRLALEG